MYKFEAKEDLKPKAKTAGSAGMDVKASHDIVLAPNSHQLVGSGVKMTECTNGLYMQLIIRSSLRVKGLTDLGTGIIDSDYRDEIKVILKNTTNQEVIIHRGERIAQLVPTAKVQLPEEFIEYSERTGGFGSTGK